MTSFPNRRRRKTKHNRKLGCRLAKDLGLILFSPHNPSAFPSTDLSGPLLPKLFVVGNEGGIGDVVAEIFSRSTP